MYGIAKGAGSIPTNGSITGELGLDSHEDSTIKKISFDTLNASIASRSETFSGVTLTGGSTVDAAITVSGTASVTCTVALMDNTSVTLDAGYYCFDTNANKNIGDGNRVLIILYNSTSTSSGGKMYYVSSTQRSRNIYVSEKRTIAIRVGVESTHGVSYPSGCTLRPRFYYLGADPFSKITKNVGIIWKSSVSTSSDDRMLEFITEMTNDRELPFYVDFTEGISCIYRIDGFQVSNKARTTVLDSKPLSFIIGKNRALSPFDSETPAIRAINTIIE